MRPIYERSPDRANQAEAVRLFCREYGVSPHETPRLAGWDYEVRRDGRTVALVEVKCRTCVMHTYPTYMVSRAKVDALRSEARAQGVAPILLVRWTDAAGWVRLDRRTEEWSDAVGGRTDRADPMDTERVAHIPIRLFTCLRRTAAA